MPSTFNSGLIVLIPKVDHADSITQFPPIALTNFVFKIINPKILALRLASIAARIISPQQHAFVPGRHISDCILMTSECFNLLDSKCHGGNVAIKVDITKAFDTLSWGFLLHVLHAFGFHQKNLHWVHALLRSAKLSLSINGRSVGYFSCGRGVRQGDLLSPLLFCLAEEVLS
ncbi:putative RNA-directed DNA polymerase [Rosa chinensis]|uniref:Putative RNA-directed DNA polymerase n=1 Tax=Rosa chinensis TaxID=74649 RepID=A0A2P6QRE8_ROSCH|nr:putative RNA-directed DNA polymerase [Rosa chinensis]